jgi:NADH-quinone oxidoreductase subunit F
MFEPVLLKNVAAPDSHLLSTYEAGGGYQALAKALREYTPDEVVNLVKQSNLRGRGGAGFPTGMKWSFVPKQVDKPKYLCCNADEGEPGTFKDRIIMERDPHQLIEGLAVSAYAIGAKTAYVYIRGEYVTAIRRLEQAIAEAHEKGYLGTGILGSNFDFAVHIHCGAGAYICGEETAMLESLEGKRAQPRLKPPFPAVAGLYASPTVINNVETLACVPHIVARGADWFRGIGPDKSPGPKLYCLSGQVRKPGLYELPMGIPLRELVEEHAGGALPGRKIKAVIPGGVSAPVIPEHGLDVRMDFESPPGSSSSSTMSPAASARPAGKD